MSEQSKKTAAQQPSVHEKMAILSELVSWFQGASFNIEGAVDKYKQAETLAEEIEKDLTKLKNDIKVVKQRFDGDA